MPWERAQPDTLSDVVRGCTPRRWGGTPLTLQVSGLERMRAMIATDTIAAARHEAVRAAAAAAAAGATDSEAAAAAHAAAAAAASVSASQGAAELEAAAPNVKYLPTVGELDTLAPLHAESSVSALRQRSRGWLREVTQRVASGRRRNLCAPWQ